MEKSGPNQKGAGSGTEPMLKAGRRSDVTGGWVE